MPHFAFEPFGFAGKRKCPGYRFGMTEATVFAVEIIRHYILMLVPGQSVEPVYGLVTQPKDEIWITIKSRK